MRVLRTMIVLAGLGLALLPRYSLAQEQPVPVRRSEAVPAGTPSPPAANQGAASPRPNATPGPAPQFGTARPARPARVVRRHRDVPSESWCAPAPPVAETAQPLHQSPARIQQNPEELVQTATPIQENPQELVQGEPALGLN
ncbi:MAG TPA: hypothetical protein VEI01_09250 [Terriglobales bacterium]|nr:hypothetical protein [Terriglobales bacterium]